MSTTIFYVFDDENGSNSNVLLTTTDANAANSYSNTNTVVLVQTFNAVSTTYTINYYNNGILIISQSITGSYIQKNTWGLNINGPYYSTGTIYNFTLGTTYTYNNVAFNLITTTLTGYNNLLWNTSSDLNGTNYNLNASYTTNTSCNFYLKATPLTYTVTYTDNGGTKSGTIPLSGTYNASFTPPSITKTGYTFNGWYTDSGFSGSSYSSAFTWTFTTNITFFAKFTINNFSLVYDPNGIGTGKTISVTAAQNITTPTLKAVGYTFQGWYTTSAATTLAANVGSTYTMPTANTTLYAKWTQNTGVKLSYLENTYGVVGTPPSISIGEYQSYISKTSKAKTSLSSDYKGKGPAPP